MISIVQFPLPRRAFTIIELLAVIAIIAILAALLLPSLAQAKWQARIAATVSNYRQIGVAFFIYAKDADGVLPMHDYRHEAGGFTETRNGAQNSGWDHDWRITLEDILPATSHPITGAPPWDDARKTDTDFIRSPQIFWYSRVNWQTAPGRFANPRLASNKGNATLIIDWLRYSVTTGNFYGVSYNRQGSDLPKAPPGESSAQISWGHVVPDRVLTTGFDGSVRFTYMTDLKWYWGNAGYKHYYKPID
ncbi:MAG: prepilin-type N-terminal cleavage/methylation domain-containing protein [Rhodothermales bacterium]|jgi:prepilin-type N-terminal cleavage/methylation domain-containing protein